MIVVADTSPINYLVLIGEIDVLTKLYGRIIIPPEVRDELLRPRAPALVRTWIDNPPIWLEIRSPALTQDRPIHLDAGEAAAIALAQELRADQIIVDELLGRQEAQRRGLDIIGTIGVLLEAHQRGFLDLRLAVERLRLTSFHIEPSILASLLGGI